MVGAIIGDINGSIYEFDNYRGKAFELFSKQMFFTDDTVMTLAIAKALMSCKEDYRDLQVQTIACMQELGKRYPASYGGRFATWLYSDTPQPYNSFGNGSAMRVSPVAYVAKSLDEVKMLSRKVTEVTHNHHEGIKGAEATAVAIWMARHHYDKQHIVEKIAEEYYPSVLQMTCDDLRKTYKFDESCQNTVPQAFRCFLEGNSFEDVLRTAISIGGDSDTLAAIACSVAEAFYGVPDEMKRKAESYLSEELLGILRKFENR